MSFSATLYNCSDDPKVLNKTFNNAQPIASITPTESCDILNPTFILNYNAAYTTCNYVFVGAPFNRRYFITDMKIDIGKKIVISCAVDVLETYKDSIKELTCNIIRSESEKEPYLPDSEYKIYSDSAPFVIAPKDSQISGMITNIDDPDEKPFIVSYVGGPRGGN